MKKICIVSDTHQKHRELSIPQCDILLHCGDFCSFKQEDEKTLKDVDLWFSESPAKHVVCIGGNHDYLLQNKEFHFAHATFLEDSMAEIAGLSIYGSPWCPDLDGFAYYANEEKLIESWRKIPRGVDILITHTPPYGLLDLPSSGAPHLGCAHLHAELMRVKPRVHVFGHVHASHGIITNGTTRFVNAAIVGGRSLEVRHAPTVITLTPKEKNSIA
jgi:Icc-related predicted phosphoesterase